MCSMAYYFPSVDKIRFLEVTRLTRISKNLIKQNSDFAPKCLTGGPLIMKNTGGIATHGTK